MKILELKNDKVIISSEALGLEFFKVLWVRDKSKAKEKAHKDISYVYYFTDFNSPFIQNPPEQRLTLIKKYAIDDASFKVDKEIENAIKAYTEINTTPAMRMLEAVNIAISKMEDYFKTVDYTEVDIDKVGKFIERLPKLQEAVNQAVLLCKKETVGNTRVRGDASVGQFEN